MSNRLTGTYGLAHIRLKSDFFKTNTTKASKNVYLVKKKCQATYHIISLLGRLDQSI